MEKTEAAGILVSTILLPWLRYSPHNITGKDHVTYDVENHVIKMEQFS